MDWESKFKNAKQEVTKEKQILWSKLATFHVGLPRSTWTLSRKVRKKFIWTRYWKKKPGTRPGFL